MKTFLEVRVTATAFQRELLLPTMAELGCRGFEETETDLLSYFETTGWGQEQVDRLRTDVEELLRTISSNARIETRVLQDENWNAQWERSLRPIEVGNRLAVKPSWVSYVNADSRIILQIDPKMSFGTGYHETTRLMLQLLEKHITEGVSVLDVGTGTGILAIAAVKLGATRAVGIDNDSWAIENSRENIRTNGVEQNVRTTDTPIRKLESGSFDVICANITLNAIIEMLPEMVRRLKSGGVLLLSGFLRENEHDMQEALSMNGFVPLAVRSEDDWIATVARKVP